MNTNLNKLQIELEQEAVSIGIEKYRKLVTEGRTADLPPGLRLIRLSVEPVAAQIAADKAEAKSGLAGKGATMYYFLEQFQDDLLAYLTAKTVISNLSKRTTVTSLAITMGKLLEDTLNFDHLKAEAPGLYRTVMKKLAKHGNANYRHVILRNNQNYAKVTTIKWGRNDTLKVGLYLINTFVAVTGHATIGTQGVGKGAAYFIQPTDEVLKYLEDGNTKCELLHPVHLPMVIKPLPWTTPFDGGFITKGLKYSLIKTANRNYLADLEHHPMPMVYKAVNALQDTAWRINSPVLRVMLTVWDSGERLGGLPSRELGVPAPMSHNPEVDTDAHKTWKREAAKVYDGNIRNRSKRVLMAQKMAIASRYDSYSAFYFPYALDWRGRAYPVSTVLTPQGDDTSKALLTFAHSKPLGVNGAYWLAVHGANCFGVDKVSFDDRTSWVAENHDKILDSAFNPLDGARLWCDADSPYMFLAFCYEYAALDMWKLQGNDEDTFMSNLPVSWDGSCNGLQNFSAMLRDEVGGKATNLVPSETPSDIYAEVARVCQAQIDAEALTGCEMATRWKGKVTRKLVKRNTMTVPYAVSKFGMKQQLIEEFKKIDEEAESLGESGEGHTWEDASYLAEHNHEAIGKVVVAARDAMQWLRDAAKVAASNSLPVQWVTPSGLLVLQNYRKSVTKEADFMIAGQRYRVKLKDEGQKLDTRKQSLGIAPNVVHSLDGAHLHRTVSYCADAGITSFAMIHDSYGTHAGDADALSALLRQAFVDQYTPDVLADFNRQLEMQLPEKIAAMLPKLPHKGTLELDGVLSSDYFFA